jgi:hypothetical protein
VLAALLKDNHDAYVALSIVHVLLFLAWLGVDTAVFYTSFRLRRPNVSAETRLELAHVLTFLDRSPRTASLLMVPIGLSLAFSGHLGLSGLDDTQLQLIFWPIVALTLALSWALVPFEHATTAGRTGTVFARTYRAVLTLLKIGIFGFFMGSGIASLVGVGGLWHTDYIAWKAILFACITLAGQWIEWGFRNFVPAFGDLIANGETPERLQRLDRAVKGAYPPVLTLYALVLAAAVIGIASARGGF